MAEKGTGILALLGMPKGKPGNDDEPSDPAHEAKADALREMFAKAEAGDWDGAADAFKDAYDACAAAKAGSSTTQDDEGIDDEEY